MARFSEAFLVTRAHEGGIPIALVPLVPLVMVAMTLVYSVSAYPFAKLSDRISHSKLLAFGRVVLIAADLVLAVHGRPRFAKHTFIDEQKVKIAPVHPDSHAAAFAAVPDGIC